MEDANTLSNIFVMFWHPFPCRTIWSTNKCGRDDLRFLLTFFVRRRPGKLEGDPGGNIKLVTGGTAIQTERNLASVLKYMLILSLAHYVADSLLRPLMGTLLASVSFCVIWWWM